MKKFQLWRVSALAGLMVVVALLCGAASWVVTGSRESALQTMALVLIVEMVAMCLIAIFVLGMGA